MPSLKGEYIKYKYHYCVMSRDKFNRDEFMFGLLEFTRPLDDTLYDEFICWAKDMFRREGFDYENISVISMTRI